MNEVFLVERIEESVAVLEFGEQSFLQIPLDLLPAQIKEGDVLRKDESGQFFLDPDETLQRKKAAANRLKKLFSKQKESPAK